MEIIIQFWSSLRVVCSVGMTYVASYASIVKAVLYPELQSVQKRYHVNALWAIFITLAPIPAHQSNSSAKELYI